VLDGEGSRRVVHINSGDAQLDGLNITGGFADQTTAIDRDIGGGVYVAGGRVTILRCFIYENTAVMGSGWVAGGSVYVSAGEVTIEECTIFSNVRRAPCQPFGTLW